jgi:catechol 2,3-dioxygenase-like lactoylglutathione lyase family enzyme
MLIASRLDHFAIAAADTQAMVQWYARVLGLVVHAEGGPTPPAPRKCTSSALRSPLAPRPAAFSRA